MKQTQPSQKDLLVLEASTYTLSSLCFQACAPHERIAQSVDLAGPELQQFNQKFVDCIRECVVSHMQTRHYISEKLMGDVDRVVQENSDLYRQFPN